MNKRLRVILSFIVLHSSFIVLFAGCGPRRTPDLKRIFEAARVRKGKPPLVIVPGILGSQLVNKKTGEAVWPSAFRSDADGLSLPMTPDLEANRDDLVPGRILERAKLARAAPEIYVYYELLRALRDYAGYRDGDWNNPGPEGDRDTFYVFTYDWRRDNVESARLLVRRLEELKGRLNRPELRFNLVAHSMGGLVARYAAMYGDRDLPPAGAAPQVTWAGATSVNKIFMIGTPNEGSAEAFATMLEGYSITEGLRRRVRLLNKLSREDAVSIPALYQLLPHAGSLRFLDGRLEPLSVDLYDPAAWREYGWSPINDPAYRARYEKGDVPDENSSRTGGRLEELDAYLTAALARARRFHEALAAAPPPTPAPVALYAFGGDCEETLSALVVLRDDKAKRWVTLTAARPLRTPAGVRIKRADVERAMYEPGDGRVTRRSLLGTSPGGARRSPLFDSALPLAYAVFACDLHSDLPSNKTLQDNALTLLVNEVLN